MESTSGASLRKWFRQPSSWLSLVAVVVSFLSYYMVYEFPGKLIIHLPDRVGVHLEGERVFLVYPITFINTGSSRMHRQILRLTSVLTSAGETVPFATIRWAYEKKYVAAGPNATTLDNLVYENRASPFDLPGGTSVTRIYDFHQHVGNYRKSHLSQFDLLLVVKTDKDSITCRGRYTLDEQQLSDPTIIPLAELVE